MIRLSIGIISLKVRAASLERLLAELWSQDRFRETELVVETDSGEETIGTKRNRVNARASGQYICHIDDDDMVAHNYVPAILTALDENPGVDCVLVRGQRTRLRGRDAFARVMDFDYQLSCVEGRLFRGTMLRTPGHLCPIRADLVKALPYKTSIKRGEDLLWSAAMAPHLKTSARAGKPGEILYFYQYDQLKKPGE